MKKWLAGQFQIRAIRAPELNFKSPEMLLLNQMQTELHFEIFFVTGIVLVIVVSSFLARFLLFFGHAGDNNAEPI